MWTFFHSIAQGLGWSIGILLGPMAVFGCLMILRIFLSNPWAKYTTPQLIKLFSKYEKRSNAAHQYEESQKAREILDLLNAGTRPPKARLSAYKVETKSSYKLSDEGRFQVKRTRRIKRKLL